MHEGCTGSFGTGKEVIDKLRMMGFGEKPMPAGTRIKCDNCGEEFEMKTLESKCPACNMVYGVTPCSANDPSRIQAAGIDY